MRLSPKSALALFSFMVIVLMAQALWWVVFMARLVGEKVDMAKQLGGSPAFVAQIHQEEIKRQMMVGTEGIFFLLLVLLGAWLIYRALVKSEELKFHQQNFLMAVTHELKTPLASIRIYLDTLQSPKIDPAKKEKVIPRMRDDIDRLGRMVENILEAGRFERSGYHLNKAVLDLSALVDSRVEELRRTATTVPLTIDKKIEPGIQFSGDSAALGRAIDAILENCLKYYNGQDIHIETALSSDAKRITLTIADRGMGFKESESKALFDRFYRVGDEMTRQQSGTGLGLYLCREIIKAHGGDVAAHSDGPGKGAKFTITLKKSANEDNSTR